MICRESFLVSLITLLALGIFPASTEEPRLNYVVSLQRNGMNVCGGALISEMHVLTAGQCVDDSKIGELSIVSGTLDIGNRFGELHYPQRIEIHPGYFKGNETHMKRHDIAVITLATPAEQNSRQETIPLPMNELIEGGWSILAGWGLTGASNNGKIRNKLRDYRPLITTQSYCLTEVIVDPYDGHDLPLCARVINTRSAPCQGDIGGPLVLNNAIVGILSHPVCRNDWYDVYTSVFPDKEFIERAMKRTTSGSL